MDLNFGQILLLIIVVVVVGFGKYANTRIFINKRGKRVYGIISWLVGAVLVVYIVLMWLKG